MPSGQYTALTRSAIWPRLWRTLAYSLGLALAGLLAVGQPALALPATSDCLAAGGGTAPLFFQAIVQADNAEADPANNTSTLCLQAAPPAPDSDGDGVTDDVDLDDDNDALLDTTEGSLTQVDSDSEGLPDRLDLDSDNDGINDLHEAVGTGGPAISSNGNGMAAGPVNGSGVASSLPPTGLLPPDTDQDGVPDWRDLDSDNDGIYDSAENRLVDTNGDGQADGADPEQDGIPASVDGNPATYGDADDPAPANGDNDAIANFRDLDSDNDTIPDAQER